MEWRENMENISKKDKARRKEKIYWIASLLIVVAIILSAIAIQIHSMSNRPIITVEIDNSVMSKRGDLSGQQFQVDNIIVASGKYRVKYQGEEIIEGKVIDLKTEGNVTTFYMRGTKETLTDVVINISSEAEKRHAGLSTTGLNIKVDLVFLNEMEDWIEGEYK
jgi:hypothetical protein